MSHFMSKEDEDGSHSNNHTDQGMISDWRYVNYFHTCMIHISHRINNFNTSFFLIKLQWLKEHFLPYLAGWERSVMSRVGFKKAEKNKMLLSQETLSGIRMTGIPYLSIILSAWLLWFPKHAVSSFIELVPKLLEVRGSHYFLSAHLNQDPLEKFFGRIWQFGGVNDNPTVAEMLKSTQALRVINSIRFDDITGNCRGRKWKGLEVEDIKHAAPLRKRKRKRKPSI